MENPSDILKSATPGGHIRLQRRRRRPQLEAITVLPGLEVITVLPRAQLMPQQGVLDPARFLYIFVHPGDLRERQQLLDQQLWQ